jgi:hypothetical protein
MLTLLRLAGLTFKSCIATVTVTVTVVQCILQTGHGRNVHLWTEDGSEKYVLSLETGALTPTDEFKYEQHADDDDDDGADVEEHTDTTMSATTSI